MKKSLQFGLALTLLATPALADKFSGKYTLQLFGPHHSGGGTVCYEFKPKGQTVPGFPNSGTWDEVDNEQLGGDFLVQGRDLHFFGSVPEGNSTILNYSYHANLNTGKGDFDWWLANTPIQATDNGTIVFIAGC